MAGVIGGSMRGNVECMIKGAFIVRGRVVIAGFGRYGSVAPTHVVIISGARNLFEAFAEI